MNFNVVIFVKCTNFLFLTLPGKMRTCGSNGLCHELLHDETYTLECNN